MAEPVDERRVLVVDDDELVGRMLATHAEALGFAVQTTTDPREFLRVRREWHPHVVVIDLVIGDMDGLDVMRGLAKENAAASVIISSGVGDRVLDAAHRLAGELGLNLAGVLPKPYRREDLAALLDKAVQPIAGDAPVKTTRSLEWSNAEFAAELQSAMRRGDLSVRFQPKICCSTRAVTGYEALARWHHDTLGDISPAVFIPRAERTGLIHDVTSFVLRESLRWFASQDVASGVRLSINISAVELNEPKLDARLSSACIAAHVEPERVIIEVTETSAMDDAVKSLEMLTRLRLVGFEVSLDDFGTGYSSVQQLARMPFTEVKVDRSFVASLTSSKESQVLVHTMVTMAHALGLKCTAEGVEDIPTLEALVEVGCDYAQGYLFGRPMTPEQLLDWEISAEVAAVVSGGDAGGSC